MITHVMVGEVERSMSFFEQVLAMRSATPAMVIRASEDGSPTTVGFADVSGPFFWIAASGRMPGYCHACFSANSPFEVRAFQAAALAAGDTDNGQPAVLPQYRHDYHAAYVIDLDGNKIEAACLAGED